MTAKILLLFLTAFSLQNENTWKKSLDKDEIVIYTRKVETTSVKEFLAKAEMEGSIKKFKQIMSEVDAYENWMPNVKSAEVIKERSQNDFTYHMKLNAPFPFTDRDVVQQIIFTQSGQELIMDLVNKPEAIETFSDYVRMPRADGRWTIQQITEDKISINFQYLTDPGGGIPTWLINSFLVKNPHLILLEIKKMMVEK